nr:hypothetical protein [Tanacetum cinerariifolium]
MHFIVVAYVEESILDPLNQVLSQYYIKCPGGIVGDGRAQCQHSDILLSVVGCDIWCGFVKLSSFLRVVHIKLKIDRLLAAEGLQFTLLMLFAKGFGNPSQVTLLRPFVFECRTPEIGQNMKLT